EGVAGREVDKVEPPADEKGVGADEECIGPLAHKTCEGCIDLRAGAGIEDLDLQSHGTGCCFHLSQHGLGNETRIDEHSYSSGSGHQLTQEFQPLRRQVNRKKIDACQVSA